MLLRPNPRHVKRLINVHRLVRSPAEARTAASDSDAYVVLSNPNATIRWLTITAQWPYTAPAILAEGQRHESGGTPGGRANAQDAVRARAAATL